MTLHGLGGFPSEHYLCLQMLGMHGTVYANYAINEADLLLALGVRFDDRVTGKVSEFAKHGKIVHIDIDPSEMNKNKVAHLPIHGDVCHALKTCCGFWTRSRPNLSDEGRSTPTGFSRSSNGARRNRCVTPTATMPSCRNMPFIGCGRSCVIAANWTTPSSPRASASIRCGPPSTSTSISPGTGSPRGGLGSMGFGLPAAMGAQAAPSAQDRHRHRRRRQLPDEHPGAGRCFTEKLPVKVLLLNNQHLGMVVQWEDRFHDGNRAHTYLGAGHGEEPYPDFVTLAKGFRCGSRRRHGERRDRRRTGGDDRQQGTLRPRRDGPLPGARAADDPGRDDGARYDQDVSLGEASAKPREASAKPQAAESWPLAASRGGVSPPNVSRPLS